MQQSADFPAQTTCFCKIKTELDGTGRISVPVPDNGAIPHDPLSHSPPVTEPHSRSGSS